MSERMAIVYGGNRGIFDGILISLLSLTEKTSVPIDVYILTMTLTDRDARFVPIDEEQRAFLEGVCRRSNADSRVYIKDVGKLYREHLMDSPNAVSDYTPYALIRLLLCKLDGLPEKLLYLDADTVINRDLTELWETDVSEVEFAAALDHYGRIFMGYHYVNSGVMLLNMRKIRETRLFERCIDRLNRRRIFLPDQTALNRLVKKKKLLPRKYNEQKHFYEDTVIQHFTKTIIWHPFFPFFYTRNITPWQVGDVRSTLTHKYDALLDRYLALKGEFENDKK